ncbi:MAG: alkaline phosphatase [Paludibacteraceae bacterium]|nr:alkaline phosphatase [Paludibacteraceae bacterium]
MNRRIMLLSTVLFIILSISVSAKSKPKNLIFIIGDGMGIAQIHTGMIKNGNTLNIEQFKHIGFSKTYSYSHFTTDSGAGGTALATGVKTRNGMIGMSPDSVAVKSVLHLAEDKKLSTGLVTACAVTHATPASFVAHQINRNMYEEIAADFLKTDIDVFIGGGRNNFEKRLDNRNLSDELRTKGYQVAHTEKDVAAVKSGKLAGLLYPDHTPAMPERGNFLPDMSMKAIELLDDNKKGFFLMIEGSQIDWAGHDNNADNIALEVIDLDITIGRVLDYARRDGNTLVIVTADHETGGLTIPDGNIKEKRFNAYFSTKNHSGVMVPVFAFGPGAEEFSGFLENTDFKQKIVNLLKL